MIESLTTTVTEHKQLEHKKQHYKENKEKEIYQPGEIDWK